MSCSRTQPGVACGDRTLDLSILSPTLYHYTTALPLKGSGGPRGRAIKTAVSLLLDHFTAVSGVDSSLALATCETSQVLLVCVKGCFSRGSPVFARPTDWPVSNELK